MLLHREMRCDEMQHKQDADLVTLPVVVNILKGDQL